MLDESSHLPIFPPPPSSFRSEQPPYTTNYSERKRISGVERESTIEASSLEDRDSDNLTSEAMPISPFHFKRAFQANTYQGQQQHQPVQQRGDSRTLVSQGQARIHRQDSSSQQYYSEHHSRPKVQSTKEGSSSNSSHHTHHRGYTSDSNTTSGSHTTHHSRQRHEQGSNKHISTAGRSYASDVEGQPSRPVNVRTKTNYASDREGASQPYPQSALTHAHHSYKTTASSADERDNGFTHEGFNQSRPLSPDRPQSRRNASWRKPVPAFKPSPPPSPPKEPEVLPQNDSKTQPREERPVPPPPQLQVIAPTPPSSAGLAPQKVLRPRDDGEHVPALFRDVTARLTGSIAGEGNLVPEPPKSKPAPPAVQQHHHSILPSSNVHAIATTTNSVVQSILNPLASVANSLKAPVAPSNGPPVDRDRPHHSARSQTAPATTHDARMTANASLATHSHRRPEVKAESRTEPVVLSAKPATKHTSEAFDDDYVVAAPNANGELTPRSIPSAPDSFGSNLIPSSKTAIHIPHPATTRADDKSAAIPQPLSAKTQTAASPLAVRVSSDDYVNVSPVVELPPAQPQSLLYQVPAEGHASRAADGLYGPRPLKSVQNGLHSGDATSAVASRLSSTALQPHAAPQSDIPKPSLLKNMPSLQNIVDAVAGAIQSRTPSPRAVPPPDNSQSAKTLVHVQTQRSASPPVQLPEPPAPIIPPVRTRSPPVNMQTHIPQYPPPPPPFPPNPPNTPVLAPKPRIASLSPSQIPSLLAEHSGFVDASKLSRSSTPQIHSDERAPSPLRQVQTVRGRGSPLPDVGLPKSHMSQSVTVPLQKPESAVVVDTQPQTAVTSRSVTTAQGRSKTLPPVSSEALLPLDSHSEVTAPLAHPVVSRLASANRSENRSDQSEYRAVAEIRSIQSNSSKTSKKVVELDDQRDAAVLKGPPSKVQMEDTTKFQFTPAPASRPVHAQKTSPPAHPHDKIFTNASNFTVIPLAQAAPEEPAVGRIADSVEDSSSSHSPSLPPPLPAPISALTTHTSPYNRPEQPSPLLRGSGAPYTLNATSATSDDNRDQLPSGWREAINRAIQSNHSEEVNVHIRSLGSNADIKTAEPGKQLGPDRFPYVEADITDEANAPLPDDRPVVINQQQALETSQHSTISEPSAPLKAYDEESERGRSDLRQAHRSDVVSSRGPVIPASSKAIHRDTQRRESSRRESIVPPAPRSRSPVPRKRVPIESIADVIPSDPYHDRSPTIPLPSPPTAYNERKHESAEPQATTQDSYHPAHRNHIQRRGNDATYHNATQRHEQMEDSYIDVPQPPSPKQSSLDHHSLTRSTSPSTEASYGHYQVFGQTTQSKPAIGRSGGFNSSRDDLPSRTIVTRSDPPPKHHRGEKRRASSPLPPESRSVSPPPRPTMAERSKTLPQSPSQTHLTAQAKKLAASEALRPPTPPLPSHYQKKRSNDVLPNNGDGGFLKPAVHLIYPDTSASDGYSMSGRTMTMQSSKSPALTAKPLPQRRAPPPPRPAYTPAKERRERELPPVSPASPSEASDDLPIDLEDYEHSDDSDGSEQEEDQTVESSSRSPSPAVRGRYAQADNGSYSDVAIQSATRSVGYSSKPVGRARAHTITLPPDDDPRTRRSERRKRSSPGNHASSSRSQHEYDRSQRSQGRRPHRSLSEKVSRNNSVPLARSRSAPATGSRRPSKGFWRNVSSYMRFMMSRIFHWG